MVGWAGLFLGINLVLTPSVFAQLSENTLSDTEIILPLPSESDLDTIREDELVQIDTTTPDLIINGFTTRLSGKLKYDNVQIINQSGEGPGGW